MTKLQKVKKNMKKMHHLYVNNNLCIKNNYKLYKKMHLGSHVVFQLEKKQLINQNIDENVIFYNFFNQASKLGVEWTKKK